MVVGQLQDLLVFDVDFNEMDPHEGRFVIATRRDATGPRVPQVDEHVYLRDDEGNLCAGRIERVGQRTLLIEPIPGTWTYTEDIRATGLPQDPGGRLEASAAGRDIELVH